MTREEKNAKESEQASCNEQAATAKERGGKREVCPQSTLAAVAIVALVAILKSHNFPLDHYALHPIT